MSIGASRLPVHTVRQPTNTMSDDTTTLTLLIKKDLKKRIRQISSQDGRKSVNNWFQVHIFPAVESLVQEQEEFYGKPAPKPQWSLKVRASK